MVRYIIDTDPGQDDAFALLLALASPEIELVGITTVAGNVPAAQTADNARRIVELGGRGDIPVLAGAARPLIRPPRPVPEIHGATGIDGWDWAPASRPPQPGHAVDWLIDRLRAEPAGIIALAPQTNLALALRQAPDIASRITRLVFMGGSYFAGGNITPAAEYNIFVDPEAAAIMLEAGVAVTAVPLDCTHSAPAPLGWSAVLEGLGNQVGRACAGMMRFFEIYGNRKHGTLSRPLHDAVAVGAVLWPELFAGRSCPVAIECQGRLTSGMTVVDWLRQTGAPDNCLWLHHCHDSTLLYQRIAERLGTLP